MSVDPKYRVQIAEATEDQPLEPREGVTKEDLDVSPASILAALKATSGVEEVLDKIPDLEAVDAWQRVAYFSVCSKSGTARYLDIWDADHFDGFTDMQRNVSECRAWFSAEGYSFWGSRDTRTGVINCYFNAPANGNYLCTAGLQSYPSSQRAVVECLIDSFSFGPLPFTGTIHQPHPCSLSAGNHHFRIRQMSGSFFFLSLTVHRV